MTVRYFDTYAAGSSSATGFIVDYDNGLILTNRHVVKPGPSASIAKFSNKEEAELKVVYYDPIHDFGFFKFNPSHLKYQRKSEIELSNNVKVGMSIRVVGNNAGEKISILQGTLARLDRSVPKYGVGKYNDHNTFYYQAASMTSGGSSGSPVIDKEGRAIALNAGSSKTSASSFYLPLDYPIKVLKIIQQKQRAIGRSLSIIHNNDNNNTTTSPHQSNHNTNNEMEDKRRVDSENVKKEDEKTNNNNNSSINNKSDHQINEELSLLNSETQNETTDEQKQQLQLQLQQQQQDANIIITNSNSNSNSNSNNKLQQQIIIKEEKLISSRDIPRGTIQAVFSHETFDALKRLNFNNEREFEIRNMENCTGLLVCKKVVLDGPAHQIVHVGDILLKINGQYIFNFIDMEFVLDDSIDQIITIEVDRAGRLETLKVKVQSLYDISPTSYYEFAGSIVHPISYQQALSYNIPVKGIVIAKPGYIFNNASIGKGAVISKIENLSYPTLEQFIEATCSYSNQHKMYIHYWYLSNKNTSKSALITIDRRWFPWQHCKFESAISDWVNLELPTSPNSLLTHTPTPQSTTFPQFSNPITQLIAPSLIVVHFHSPFPVCGCSNPDFVGTGIVIDTTNGLVVTDRNTVPYSFGDCSLIISSSIELPASVLFTHPDDNYSILQYDVSLVGSTPLRAIRMIDHRWDIGEQCVFVGCNSSGSVITSSNTITQLDKFSTKPAAPPRYRSINIELFSIDNAQSSVGGVLCNKRGEVGAFWFSFSKWKKDKAENQVFRGLPVDVITSTLSFLLPPSVFHSNINIVTSDNNNNNNINDDDDSQKKCIKLTREEINEIENKKIKSLEVEMWAVPLYQGRQRGLPDRLINEIQNLNGRRQILTVKRTVMHSPASTMLKAGDLILSINRSYLSSFMDVTRIISKYNKRTPLSIIIDGNEVTQPIVDADISHNNNNSGSYDNNDNNDNSIDIHICDNEENKIDNDKSEGEVSIEGKAEGNNNNEDSNNNNEDVDIVTTTTMTVITTTNTSTTIISTTVADDDDDEKIEEKGDDDEDEGEEKNEGEENVEDEKNEGDAIIEKNDSQLQSGAIKEKRSKKKREKKTTRKRDSKKKSSSSLVVDGDVDFIDMKIWRKNSVKNIRIALNNVSGVVIEKLLVWAGAFIQENFRELLISQEEIPDGIYVGRYFLGSPADFYALNSRFWIVQVNEKPVATIDQFIEQVRNIKDEFVRLKTIDFAGKDRVVAIKPSLYFWPTYLFSYSNFEWHRTTILPDDSAIPESVVNTNSKDETCVAVVENNSDIQTTTNLTELQ